MGYFDLPRGEFELLLKKKGRGRFKAEWKNVMMTDSLYPGDAEQCIEDWSRNYKVMGCRFNGREIKPKTKYHWEIRKKDEVFGRYATRLEAKAALDEARMRELCKPRGERKFVGTIYFVEEL